MTTGKNHNKWEAFNAQHEEEELQAQESKQEDVKPSGKGQKFRENPDKSASSDSPSTVSDAQQQAADTDSEPEIEMMDMDAFQASTPMEEELAELREKLADAQQQILTKAAEMQNLQARSERETKKRCMFANERIINKLLPVLDSLSRGLEVAPSDAPEVKAVRDGLQMTFDLLQDTLREFGVEAIVPVEGDVFDPNLHEAMSMQQDAALADNVVAQLLQPGYQLHDRVLRAAMVIVNRHA